MRKRWIALGLAGALAFGGGAVVVSFVNANDGDSSALAGLIARVLSTKDARVTIGAIDERKAEAEAKDLMHGSMFVPSVEVTAGPIDACSEAGIVVITAGAKQKPGQTRLQLAGANVAIFRDMIPRIAECAPHRSPAFVPDHKG